MTVEEFFAEVIRFSETNKGVLGCDDPRNVFNVLCEEVGETEVAWRRLLTEKPGSSAFHGELEMVADGIADTIYTLANFALALGIDLPRVLEEVTRSNATKKYRSRRDKGPDYSPPDLSFVREGPPSLSRIPRNERVQ